MTDRRDDDDVLDADQARRFAWRIEAPPEQAPPEPAPPEVTPELAPAAAREVDEALAQTLSALRSRIDRVWAMSPAKQPAATIALIGEAEKLGPRLVALGGDPTACVRLARLVTRHFGRLPRSERRFHVHTLCWLTLAGPELGALLVDVARRGERDLDWMIARAVRSRAVWRAAADAVPELARMLAEAPRWTTRELCVRYLCAIGGRDAVTAVRRALRLPHLRCRYLALRGLEAEKGELTEDDVRFLLEDAVAHPLEDGSGELHFDAVSDYPQRVAHALAFVRPEGGHAPLEIILDGGGEHIRRERVGLDEGWALLALATGWPERAAWWARRMLAAGSHPWQAVEAARHLPEADARALLIDVVTSADADLIERARAAFLARFGSEPIVAPEDGLPLPFEGPPSERALSRLAVLRGQSREAKAKLAAALLDEAPDREAATLLVFLVGRSWGISLLKGPELPGVADAWAKRLVERFGAPALDGLVRLAERDAAAGVMQGWMWRVLALDHQGLLDAASKERLRAAAIAAFRAPGWRPIDDALFALSRLGAPRELWPALFEVAVDAPPADGFVARYALEALAMVEPDAELDARLVREAEAAVAGHDWPRAARALSAAWERGSSGARELGERLLARIDELPASAELRALAGSTAHRLHGHPLELAWVERALREPASLRFDLACGLLARHAEGAALALLRAALASEARGGAAAACAAARLVWARELAASDPRVDAILRACPPAAAVELLAAVMEHRKLAELAPVVRRVLACDDAKAATDCIEDLHLYRPAGYEDLIAAALTAGALHPAIEETARFLVGEPSDTELYWQDDPDEDDELD